MSTLWVNSAKYCSGEAEGLGGMLYLMLIQMGFSALFFFFGKEEKKVFFFFQSFLEQDLQQLVHSQNLCTETDFVLLNKQQL